MPEWKPNAKFDHVYVIVRVESVKLNADLEESARLQELEDMIAIKKVVWSRDSAEKEVERLNQLNRDKGARYFWQISRLERKERLEPHSLPGHRSGS